MTTKISTFDPPSGGPREHHLIATPPEGARGFPEQLASLEHQYAEALASLGLGEDATVFVRIFASDLALQEGALRGAKLGPAPRSLVQQPPLPARKLALWAYLVERASPSPARHLWSADIGRDALDNETRPLESHAETERIMNAYRALLARHGATFEANVVRTWIYVRDVDRNYQGMVEARRALFDAEGLTSATHYIASTGIEGRTGHPTRLVSMDAYAIAGLARAQVRYLSAPRHLGPTNLYGVTFERATEVSYADRAHIYVSGTASIDPSGATLHIGDVARQTERAIENVEALLSDGGAGPDALQQLLVYLRDAADLPTVERIVARRWPDSSPLYLWAPVCRPTWLVELEGIAVVPRANPSLPPF